MKAGVDILFSRPVLVAAGLLAANSLIWFLGPLLTFGDTRPLETELSRWIAVTAFGVVAAAYATANSARQARRNHQLLDGLVSTGRSASGGAAPGTHDLAIIGKRFEEAVAQLRRSRIGGKRRLLNAIGGRPYVYQLPWYIIIGAPGAGKTTALANSGLEFPLANKLGHRGVRGIGGTRNCDWWFTGEAVLIDTAGRFTTQDSDQASDQTVWFGFLELLRKYRPRRPINGVLLTVSVSDLLTASREEQQQHARRLRERLEELYVRLGAAIPVYVLVTKVDLLAGFIEFFADFDKDERAQVWGVTFPFDPGPTSTDPLARMPSELVSLEKRLDERLIERLHGESDRERRAAIYAFPQQWRVLRETLVEFLRQAFAGLPVERRSLVRGIYFTSATQEGTPMDRALGGLSRALGLASRIVAPARPTGKSFFVTLLLREVVFAEAGLVGSNLRWKKRRVLLEWSAIALTLGAVATSMALAWNSYLDNSAYLDAIDERLSTLKPAVTEAKNAAPTDLIALLPVLDTTQALGRAPAASDANSAAPLVLDMGLDQRERIFAAGQDAYGRLLKDAFLPRIAARLEERLRTGGQERIESLYESLKAYLMLFRGKNFDRQALAGYLRADWDLTLPTDVSAEVSASLRRHFDRLVSSGEVGAPVLADQQLIDNARSLVAHVPIDQRAYSRLQSLDLHTILGSDIQDFTILSGAGPMAKQVFVRKSGRPLTRGVPALYSRAAHDQIRRLSEGVLNQLAGEADWVLGTTAPAGDETSSSQLYAAIEQRYVSDYLARWDEFLRDIRVVPTSNLAQSAQVAQTLARADSPLLNLFSAAAQELSFEFPPRGDAVQSRAKRGALAPGYEHLRALGELVNSQHAPLHAALTLLGRLSSYLAAVDDAISRKVEVPSSDVAGQLTSLATQTPEPVRSMLQQIAASSVGQIFSARRDDLGRRLASEVGVPCSRAVQGHYPFVQSSRDDVSREEFAKTFAAGGLIDGFFQRQLAPYANTSARLWTLPSSDGGQEPTPSLQQFQRAQLIRSAFFADGGRTLGSRLEFRLLEMDPGISSFDIDVDGQLMHFSRNTRAGLSVKWPDVAATMRRVQLRVTTTAGAGSQHSFDGHWGLLRLLERVRKEPGASADRLLVHFDVEGHRARFEIRSAAPVNPLRLQTLEQFQCPQRL
jgi:type VI secretion system protein ImpL